MTGYDSFGPRYLYHSVDDKGFSSTFDIFEEVGIKSELIWSAN
jgi:hypothetical protein